MRVRCFLLLLAAVSLVCGQKLQLNLDHLAAKAVKVDNVNLDGPMLRSAGSLLSAKDSDENTAKQVASGMKGIYVCSFKFDKPGAYTDADVESVRSQLRQPGWSKLVSSVNKKQGMAKIEEIYFHSNGHQNDAMAILDIKPLEFTVVNIVGSADLGKLADFGKLKDMSLHYGAVKGQEKKD